VSTLKVSLMGLSSRLVAIGLAIASTLILAHVLRPEGIGQYFLFLRVVALLAVLADFGFSQSTSVFTGRGESPRQIHGLLIRFSICSSTVVLLAFLATLKLLGSTILPNYPASLQVATIIAVPSVVYAAQWRYLMVGLARIGTMNLIQIGFAAVTCLAVVIAMFGLSMGLPAAVAIYTGAVVVQALVMAAIARSLGRDAAEARHGLFREMFRFGLRGAGGAIATMLWQRSPVFMLNVFQGPAAVGVFSVGQQLTEKALLPMEAMQDAIYRRMTRLPPSEARTAMNRYIRISGWSMCVLLLTAGVVLPLVIVFILGPTYRAAVPVVLALLPGTVAISTTLLVATYFLAQLGRPGLLSMLASVTLGVTLLLSAALIPAYGPTGAALALSGAQIGAMATVVTIYLRTTGSRFLELVTIDRQDRDLCRTQIFLLLGRPDE
jgi:O-antigen/teichoic acid export membrane protein